MNFVFKKIKKQKMDFFCFVSCFCFLLVLLVSCFCFLLISCLFLVVSCFNSSFSIFTAESVENCADNQDNEDDGEHAGRRECRVLIEIADAVDGFAEDG